MSAFNRALPIEFVAAAMIILVPATHGQEKQSVFKVMPPRAGANVERPGSQSSDPAHHNGNKPNTRKPTPIIIRRESSINVSGTWDDSYNFVWTLSQDQSGNITGNVQVSGCTNDTWTVSGGVTGSSTFDITATNPDGGDSSCVSWFEYDMTLSSSSSASGTWTNSDGSDGSVTMTLVSAPVTINSPTQGATYAVGGSAYNVAGPVTYNATTADGSNVSWNTVLTYTTSGGKCTACTSTQNFSTASGANGTESYTSIGGQLVATAADDMNDTANVTTYIVGTDIPTATEVSLLDSIYPGPTSNLMSGIAQVESSTAQFASITNFGIDAYWPTESPDGGSHIGLMQLPVAMGVAWDFTINADSGEALFEQKGASATRIMNKAIKTYVGLTTLTAVQIENMALVLYGPYAKAGITNQYYAPYCQGGTASGTTCTGGTWVWIVNTANNPKGVAYANKCRNSVQ